MRNSGFLRYVRERSIAVVVIERVDGDFQATRTAHHVQSLPLAPLSLTGPRNGIVRKIHIARDKQIRLSIAVVIDKTAARVPLVARSVQAGLLRYVSERAVAIVVVHRVLAPVGNEQIQVAVVVEIACATALAPACAGEAGLFGDI